MRTAIFGGPRTASASLALALALAVPAQAQEAVEETSREDDSALLDTVVVTAQKREQAAQDVAISLTAYSARQIEALGLDQTTEITEQIPALQLNTWSPNVTIFNLRGISQNNFTDNLEAPVAAYFDGAYMATLNGISGQLFDTERVEVLRGPQGTLFGRNATGGLIHYLSRAADSDELNGYVKGSVANFGSYQIEAAGGGQIWPNVRLRLAGRYATARGYVISTDTNPNLSASGQDIGGENGWAIRGNLQFDVTDAFNASFWVKFSQDIDVPTGGYVFANCNFLPNGYCAFDSAGLANGRGGVINGITGEPASPYANFGEQAGFFNRDTLITQLDLNYAFDNGISLTSITNYTSLNKDYLEDGDALPVLVINFGNAVEFWQVSEELRASGYVGNLEWQTGFYFLHFRIDGLITTVGAPVVGAAQAAFGGSGVTITDQMVRQDYLLESTNYSVFAQAEYEFLPALSLVFGIRYSHDLKSIDYISNIQATVDSVRRTAVRASDEMFAGIIDGINRIDYGDVAVRVGLDWRPLPDTLLFASYNRGIKGGNWTLASDIEAANFRHRPEVLNSIEIGLKHDVPAARLRLNSTLFYYLYDDYQAFALTGGTPQVTNSDAASYGGELEAIWSPLTGLDLSFGLSGQSSNVDEVQGAAMQVAGNFLPPMMTPPPAVADGVCVYRADSDTYLCDYTSDTVRNVQLPNAPAVSINYVARYNIDSAVGNFAIQLDGVWYDRQFLEVTNGLGSLQENYALTNISATWTSPDGHYKIHLFGKNIGGTQYAAYSLNLGILGTTQFYGAPATYGLTLSTVW